MCQFVVNIILVEFSVLCFCSEFPYSSQAGMVVCTVCFLSTCNMIVLEGIPKGARLLK